jgi:hypothetical protein
MEPTKLKTFIGTDFFRALDFLCIVAGQNVAISYAIQRTGTNYKVIRYASAEDMYNNQGPVVLRDSTSTVALNDLGLAPGTYVYKLIVSYQDWPTAETSQTVTII